MPGQSINCDAIVELKDIMGEDFSLLIDTFVEDSAIRLEVIATAIEQSDAEALRGAAHSFKGSSSNICAVHLPDLCQKLEACGLEGDLAVAPEIFSQIRTEYEQLKTDLLNA